MFTWSILGTARAMPLRHGIQSYKTPSEAASQPQQGLSMYMLQSLAILQDQSIKHIKALSLPKCMTLDLDDDCARDESRTGGARHDL